MAQGGKKEIDLGRDMRQGNPWACPRCGCTDFRTINSYLCKDGTRHRRQYCRHCKYVRMTYESPGGTKADR